MATFTSPPIMVWQPGGGVSGGPISNPPVYSQNGVTPLVAGQSYVDVVFDSVQTTEDWVLVECVVVNEIDANPLNIWSGIITDKTAAGFRLQLNGMPDSSNYYLHWAVSGINIVPIPATTYILTGPASGLVGVALTFTVHLPSSTTGTATITPSDSGGGGTFSPPTVMLTTGVPSVTFTYTPGTSGTKTVSVTNTGGLINPASIVVTVSPVATGYSLTGPSNGVSGVASAPFTVTLTPAGYAVPVPVTVTPSDGGGGGTFAPTTVNLTTAAPSATFTYTPASGGAKTISTTNNGGLTDPGSLTYTVTVPLADGDPVSTWPDSSGNGHAATQTGAARPIYKTGIVGGKPVVRFTTAGSKGLNLASTISGAGAFTVITVLKATGGGVKQFSIAGTQQGPMGPVEYTGVLYTADRVNLNSVGLDFSGAFHVLTGTANGAGVIAIFNDGTAQSLGGATAFASTGDFTAIGYRPSTPDYSDGDIAEVIVYNSILGSTDRQNVEKYLGQKYSITVAGGSAVQPNTVTGLLGWWKADSL